jgi:hypothetical protein
MGERTKITALTNGPYLVQGPIVLLDAEGSECLTERATVTLCRCGDLRTSCSATAPIRGPVSWQRRGLFEQSKE